MRKAISTVVRVLGHPAVSAASTAYWIFTSIPAVLALVTALLGDVLGEPALFIAALGLGIVAVVLAVVGYVRSRSVQRASAPSQDTKPRDRPSDLAGQSMPTLRQHPGRVYGGAAVGVAVRQHIAQQEENDVFVAAEGEIALILEEAVELKRLLWDEWPYLASGLEEAILDWRTKATDFIGKTLGSGQRAAFRAASVGSDTMIRLEAEEKFLADLARNLAPSSIRVNEEEFLAARATRRRSLATEFLDYDHFRAPGAPPPAGLADQIHALMHEGSAMFNEFSAPLQPEKVEGGWKLSEKEAPDDWWRRTQDLYDRAWSLLHEKAPGRIKTFGDAFKEHLDKAHAGDGSKASADRLSTPKEIREFFASRHKEPALIVEAILEALAVVRNEMESAGAKSI